MIGKDDRVLVGAGPIFECAKSPYPIRTSDEASYGALVLGRVQRTGTRASECVRQRQAAGLLSKPFPRREA
jgi:hypothetical protein